MSENQLILRTDDDVGSELVPSFMHEDRELTKSSTEKLGDYVYPPRVKVIQSNAEEQYSKFQPGDVVLVPQGIVVAHVDEAFHFVPLLFYPEWAAVNPIETKGQLPMFRERTFDPNSTLARKARNPDLRREPCPECAGKDIKNTEFLTFICLILNNEECLGMPVALSFSSGSHRDGSQLSSLVKMRRCPIFGGVYEGKVPKTKRKNTKGQWYAIEVGNPSVESGVESFVQDPAVYDKLKELHLQLKETNDRIMVQYDEDPEDEALAAAGESKF